MTNDPHAPNEPSERARILAYLDNQAQLLEPFDRPGAGILDRIRRSIEAGVHWAQFETEPQPPTPFD